MAQGVGGEVSRRGFLAGSMAGLMAGGLPAWYAKEVHAERRERAAGRDKKYGPNDQINLGCIGPGGHKGGFSQGFNDTRNIAGHKGVKVVAVCDVDSAHRDEAAEQFGPDCAKYSDFRELLARKEIDAVVIGTPDHWHAVIAAAALRAGKDVYCEKPLTLTIDEGKRLVRVARNTKQIFQVGSQQRSDPRFRFACELVRNGRVGKLKTVHANLPGGPVGGPFKVKPVPSDLNWDMWQGPTPATAYIPERTHGTFRHWLEYSGGMMTDWGAHHNDIAQWGIGADHSGPIAVHALGTRHFGYNCFNAFQEFEVTYTYPDNITLITSNKGDNGVQFEGENGWIFVTRGGINASDQKLLDEPLPSGATRLYASDDHHGNFVDCIRSRNLPICDVEIGYRSVSVCHIGNICLRLGGRNLEWDPQREQFKEDREANAMLSRPMRNGWHV